MQAVGAVRAIRLLTIALVLWVNVDVGFCSACAGDPAAPVSSALAVLSAGGSPICPSAQLPHTSHCFYHSHWVEVPSPAPPIGPVARSQIAGVTFDGPPDTVAQPLDHPPRLLA